MGRSFKKKYIDLNRTNNSKAITTVRAGEISTLLNQRPDRKTESRQGKRDRQRQGTMHSRPHARVQERGETHRQEKRGGDTPTQQQGTRAKVHSTRTHMQQRKG